MGAAMQYFGIDTYLVYWGLAAVLIQALAPLFFILGFFFRTACFFLFSVMLVAFLYHWFAGDPIVQIGSHAGKMAALFFCFMFIGPGAYSVRE
jgi:putative oxidoreductase